MGDSVGGALAWYCSAIHPEISKDCQTGCIKF